MRINPLATTIFAATLVEYTSAFAPSAFGKPSALSVKVMMNQIDVMATFHADGETQWNSNRCPSPII